MEYRELTRDELGRVPGALEPLPQSMVGVGAVSDDGEVVAACGMYTVVQLDPLWVREDYRKSPVILKRLWESTRAFLAAKGVKSVFSGVLDGYPGPEHESVIERLSVRLAGGKPFGGRIWVIEIGGDGDHG